jgi:predicted XRE-type DNA-binding protein
MAKELNDAGMTQRLISKLFGVSPSYINHVIKGRVVTYV